jgi:hypothetical protein
MKSIFDTDGVNHFIHRINQLSADTKPQWGKMNAGQMLAHCTVAYDMTFTDKYPRPNAIARFFIKLLAKPQVVGPKPYPKNSRTAPQFVISDQRDFEKEKQILIDYLRKAQAVGADEFHLRESHAMGKLTSDEWNMLFAKHLDHHLTQFGV